MAGKPQRQGGRRRCPELPPVRVHRDTLQHVLESLLSQCGAPDSPPAPTDDSDSALAADDPAPAPKPTPRRSSKHCASVSRQRWLGGKPAHYRGFASHEPHAVVRGLLAPDRSISQLRTQMYRAAQHAASSELRRHRLEAYHTACLLLPQAPRLVWEQALALHLSDGADVARLQTLVEHFRRHAGLDRPAIQLSAFSALVAVGRADQALELAAGTSDWNRCRRVRDNRLWRAVCEWARYRGASADRQRRTHLTALRHVLQSLTAEGQRRPDLAPLLQTVAEQLPPEDQPTTTTSRHQQRQHRRLPSPATDTE